MKKSSNWNSRFAKKVNSDKGNAGGIVEAGLVFGLVALAVGGAISLVIGESEKQVANGMIQANKTLADNLVQYLRNDASVPASDLTASLPTSLLPRSIIVTTGGAWQGQHGGSVVPTGTGARGFVLTWNAVTPDQCRESLVTWGTETGAGRLTAIAVNGAAQVLPLNSIGRNAACDEAGRANIVALTYSTERG